MTKTLDNIPSPYDKSNRRVSVGGAVGGFAKDVAAGTCGGVAICLVGHPFDTLKVRLQTQPTENPLYSGLFDCFKKTLKWEGIGGLYRGVGSPLAGQMFFRAILFSTYFQSQKFYKSSDDRRLTEHEYFACGALTGGVVSLVEGPVDLFKSKMQAQIIREKVFGEAPRYRNVFDCAGKIMTEHGYRGVYQGLSATLARNIPAFGTYFSVMEVMRDHYSKKLNRPVKELPFYTTMVSGATGGILYWLLFYPLDVVKSAMQADNTEHNRRKYAGFGDCIRRLEAEGGISRFYRGFTPCMLRSIPANAVLFTVVDEVRKLLNTWFS